MKNNLIGISGDLGDTVGNILQYLTAYGKYPSLESFMARSPITGGTPYQIKKFDNKRKDIVCLLLGCTREQLEDREFKEKELGEEWWYQEYINKLSGHYEMVTYKQEPPSYVYNDDSKGALIKLTPNKLLQLIGTECGRQILHPNIWVNALFSDYKVTFKEELYFPAGLGSPQKIDKAIIPNWIITDVKRPDQAQAIKDRGGVVIRVDRGYALENEFDERTRMDNEHPSETALDDYEFDAVIDNNGSIEELVEKVKQLNIL